MQVLKCDMCGTVYDPYHNVETMSGYSVNTIILSERNGFGLTTKGLTYDVCPHCMKTLLDMLKERK